MVHLNWTYLIFFISESPMIHLLHGIVQHSELSIQWQYTSIPTMVKVSLVPKLGIQNCPTCRRHYFVFTRFKVCVRKYFSI